MSSVTLKPNISDSTTLNIPPITVKSPFTPQAQPTSPLSSFLTVKTPKGKGIPRKNPTGKRSSTVMMIRKNDGDVKNISVTTPCTRRIVRPETMAPTKGQLQRLSDVIDSFPDHILPIPADNSIAKTTVE